MTGRLKELPPDRGAVAVAQDPEELVVPDAALDELLLGDSAVAVLVQVRDHPPGPGFFLGNKSDFLSSFVMKCSHKCDEHELTADENL